MEVYTYTTPNCLACRFADVQWRKGDEYEYLIASGGEMQMGKRSGARALCRRWAPRGPVVWTGGDGQTDSFPGVSDGDWCGEFEAHKYSALTENPHA